MLSLWRATGGPPFPCRNSRFGHCCRNGFGEREQRRAAVPTVRPMAAGTGAGSRQQRGLCAGPRVCVCVCACVYVCVRGRSLAALTVSAPSLPRPAQCTRPRSARCAGSRGAGSSSATCRTAPGSRRGSRPAWRDSGSPPGKAPRAAGTPTRPPQPPSSVGRSPAQGRGGSRAPPSSFPGRHKASCHTQ